MLKILQIPLALVDKFREMKNVIKIIRLNHKKILIVEKKL